MRRERRICYTCSGEQATCSSFHFPACYGAFEHKIQVQDAYFFSFSQNSNCFEQRSLKKHCCRHPVCLVRCGHWHKLSQNRNWISDCLGTQTGALLQSLSDFYSWDQTRKYRLGAVAPNNGCCAFCFSYCPKFSIDNIPLEIMSSWIAPQGLPVTASPFSILRWTWLAIEVIAQWHPNPTFPGWS